MTANLPTKLSTLKPGQYATIFAVHADEELHHRLLALGFRIGKRIEMIRRSFLKGPLQVRLGTTDVIIRSRDAECIDIYHP